MFHLIYKSTAINNLTPDHLKNILESAITFNQTVGITGCLIYFNGFFVQFLEGSQENVEQLFYERISNDKRHTNIQLLKTGTHANHIFKQWNMAYYHFNQENASQLEKLLFIDNLKIFISNLKSSGDFKATLSMKLFKTVAKGLTIQI